jgi:hypothetical protein
VFIIAPLVCVLFLFLAGIQFVDHKNLPEMSFMRTFLPSTTSEVDTFVPANALEVPAPYNPFTEEGRAFWSSVVSMNFTPGIFDDCNKIAGGLEETRQLLPDKFLQSYIPFKKKVAAQLKKDHVGMEGTSLQYIKESLVLWNIISKVPYVKTVCETGFNTGEGTLLWLSSKPDVHVYSFDIGTHVYAKPLAEHIQNLYPGRHNITWGDSTETVPAFVEANPNVICDIIYVDGGHTYGISKEDFDNFAQLGYTGSIVFLDNYPDYRSTFMKDLGGMWEDNRRLENVLEVFKCSYGRKRSQGFSFGILTKLP